MLEILVNMEAKKEKRANVGFTLVQEMSRTRERTICSACQTNKAQDVGSKSIRAASSVFWEDGIKMVEQVSSNLKKFGKQIRWGEI